MRERDIPLVEISLAVRFLRQRNWLNPEDLDQLLSRVSERSGLAGFVSEIRTASLLEAGKIQSLVTRVHNQLRRIHADLPESRVIDGKFGRIAMSAGWLAAEDLEMALLEQSRLRRQGLRFRLGEILFKMELLTRQQVETVLEKQGQRVKTCSSCQKLESFSTDFCDCGRLLQPGPLLCPMTGDFELI
jgi:hypothetical protein